jgi:Domain of unknown function (DUF4440)
VPFDARAETDRLQDAVRRHDHALLDELVSGRFALVSARSLGRLDKEAWIASALQVEWKDFVVSVRRVIDMESFAVVDYDIDQEMAAAPSWAPGAPTKTQWVVTDVWGRENGQLRLVCRHPELRH